MPSSDGDILFERRGAAGIVTLNRPKALNAVTHDMVRALRAELDRWANDPAITRIVIMAAGERAFSAGGDIRALYDLGKAGRIDDALQFWRDEYPLNLAIKNYRKPYVALIDGIAMGGGVGVSVHGSHRIAGDRFSFAMPEAGIGFFPDVGATWFLPRMPGELGAYCALTGDRFGVTDAVSCGVATHRIPSAQFDAVLDGLMGTVSVDAVLAAFAQGETRMRGLAELRVKESDRLAVTSAGLAACGVETAIEGDDLIVMGKGSVSGGGTVETHMDHRIAMAFLTLGLGAEQPVTVDDVAMIATSFPAFVPLMTKLGGQFR